MIPKRSVRAAARCAARDRIPRREDPHATFRLAVACAAPGRRSRARRGGRAERPFRFEELAKVRRARRLRRLARRAVGSPSRSARPTSKRTASRSAIWIVPSGGRRAAPADLGREARFRSRRSRPTAAGSRFSPTATAARRSGRSTSRAATRRRRRRFPTEVNGFTWSPDGKWFVITSDVFPDCADAACLEKTLKARAKSKTKARVAERLLFRHWDAWKDGLRTHIWKVAASAGGRRRRPDPGRPRRAALRRRRRRGLRRVAGRDGASSTRRTPTGSRRSRPTPTSGSSRSPAAAPAKDLTAANKAFDGSPKFSPDGKWIAYRAQKRPGFESDRFRLMLFDRATGADPRPDGGLRLLGRGLRVGARLEDRSSSRRRSRGRERIYRVGARRRSAGRRSGAAAASRTRALARRARIFFRRARSRARPRSGASALDGKAAGARSPTSTTRLFAELEMGEVSERFTKSADGRKLQAWLVKPPASTRRRSTRRSS